MVEAFGFAGSMPTIDVEGSDLQLRKLKAGSVCFQALCRAECGYALRACWVYISGVTGSEWTGRWSPETDSVGAWEMSR